MLWKNPHCEDGLFEENARNVLEAHVDVEYDVHQLFQVDVDDDLDAVDGVDLSDVQ